MKKVLLGLLLFILIPWGVLFIVYGYQSLSLRGIWIPFDESKFTNTFENDFYSFKYPEGVIVFDDTGSGKDDLFLFEINSGTYMRGDIRVSGSNNENNTKTVHIRYGDRYADIEVCFGGEHREDRLKTDYDSYIRRYSSSNCAIGREFTKTFGEFKAVWHEINDCGNYTFRVLIPMDNSFIHVYAGSQEPLGEGSGGPDNTNLAVLRNIISTIRIKDSYYEALWSDKLSRRFDKIEDIIEISDTPEIPLLSAKEQSKSTWETETFQTKYFSVALPAPKKVLETEKCGYKYLADLVSFYIDYDGYIFVRPTWDESDIDTDITYKRVKIGDYSGYKSVETFEMRDYKKAIYLIPLSGWAMEINTHFRSDYQEIVMRNVLSSIKVTDPDYLTELSPPNN